MNAFVVPPEGSVPRPCFECRDDFVPGDVVLSIDQGVKSGSFVGRVLYMHRRHVDATLAEVPLEVSDVDAAAAAIVAEARATGMSRVEAMLSEAAA